MLNEKLNLYNPEWLELVFHNRNKAYGAYELRKTYGATILKSMAIAFGSIIIVTGAYTYAKSKHIEPLEHITTLTIPDLPPPPKQEDKIIEQPKKAAATATPEKPLPAAASTKFTIPHITPKEVDTDMPTINELAKTEVGAETTKGDGGIPQIAEPAPALGSGGDGTETDLNAIKDFSTIEVMPEPDGGAAGWSKFLSKNLRYPSQAQEEGKSGRVMVSFVVERDGRLTDITVTGKAGYGMDEEAIRVLKLAKPWKPGIQNGRAVRVRYSIPMNFQLSE
ncbi:energy transducer TonB [Mucilaginibacter achroorhodeus]|uniref:Energy transducer TonB n=1 Tax=Mucilaginibacter achroorhodeus TaxID=2599294 RepID=A0A563U694_9SPHI|nr:energy transducer TonB [Mucilaginibacter achroorhodeus]TWR26870.1 energy transducer TonB [Mucilaginibacter achroorhodeus]